MICPECGQANAESARFCSSCGTALTTGGLTARATPIVPSPYAKATLLPSQQGEMELPTPEANTTLRQDEPLRAGTSRLDEPALPASAAIPEYGATIDTAPPVRPTAEATESDVAGQTLFGVAPGAVSPFQVSPHTIPPGEALPVSPVHMTAPAPSMPSPAMPPTGYAPPGPLYAVSCRVCGNSLASNMSQCPRCGAPVGTIVNAGDPTANSYLPVGAPGAQPLPVGLYYGAQAVANNSGQRGAPPAELPTNWNWGAAFVTYFWAVAHRVWWYVALQSVLILVMIALWIGAAATGETALTGLAALVFVFYAAIWVICRVSFGLHGNRMAWRRRHFDSIYQFMEVQEAWKPVGIVLSAIVLLCILAFGGTFIFLYALGSSMAR
jgi:hypothetical protein